MFEYYVGSQYVCIREESSTPVWGCVGTCYSRLDVFGGDVSRNFLLQKQLQYLDAHTRELHTASRNQLCYRLSIKTIVFFVSECLIQIDLTSVFFFFDFFNKYLAAFNVKLLILQHIS